MSRNIEIYVRPSGDQILLNLYVPEAEQESFLNGLNQGTFVSRSAPIAVELSLLPDWVTDEEVRRRLTADLGSIHARIPISAINIQITD